MGTDELDSLLLAEEAQEASPDLFGSPLGAAGSSPSHAAAGEQAAAKPKDKEKKASKGNVRVLYITCIPGYEYLISQLNQLFAS